MQVKLITPEKTLFEGAATYVQVPGVLGEFGVMPNHEPFISLLKAGTVGIESAGAARQEFHVTGGVAQILHDNVTLLVES
jgi:F-type H+-transporting ATPase subunit epsilon